MAFWCHQSERVKATVVVASVRLGQQWAPVNERLCHKQRWRSAESWDLSPSIAPRGPKLRQVNEVSRRRPAVLA
jgi:hypothetical protein